MKRQSIGTIFFVSFLFVLIAYTEGLADQGQTPRAASYLYYAGTYTNLHGSNLDLWGADIKEEEVTSAGSQAGTRITWGRGAYQSFAVDFYSTNSLLPSEFGKDNEKDLSLSSFAAILGQPARGWPSLRIARSEFWGIGVVNGSVPYYDGDRRMSNGEEFDLGVVVDTYYLVWSTGNIGMVKPDKPISGFGFLYSLGVAYMKVTGVAYDNAECSELKRIKVYSGSRYDTIGGLTKLQGFALEVGAKLYAEGDLNGANGVIAFSGWGGGNAGHSKIPSGALLDIDAFVRNGGRAVFFMTSASTDEMNPLITDLYMLALAKEIIANKPNIVSPGEGFFPFWKDLRVGCGSVHNYRCQILSYIGGRIPKTATIAKLKSEESNRERPISVELKLGNGRLWISNTPCMNGGGNPCHMSGSFLHDRQIDRLDNTEAARRLIKWLAQGDMFDLSDAD